MSFRTKISERLRGRDRFLDHRTLRWLGDHLRLPALWHFGRRSVAGACGVGLFVAFCPLPIHMVIAPPLALLLRVNLPIVLTLIWVSNPLTLVPILILSYRVGCWVLGTPVLVLGVGFTGGSLLNWLDQIWRPLCVGSLICGTTAGTCGYLAVTTLWRLRILHQLRRRRHERLRT
ncbi:MAG: DUF2062 domain-containing protein [Gammaproteobacteria bacterium]